MKALFLQLNWSVANYTRDVINSLADLNIEIDFITTSNSITPYASPLELNANVSILLKTNVKLYRAIWSLWRVLSIFTPFVMPVDPIIRQNLNKKLKNRKYDFVIAIEKESLLAALNVFHGEDTRIYYWSLELYNPGHPAYYKYRRLNEFAQKIYKKINGIIVQDKMRWNVINRGVEIQYEPFILPIGNRGQVNKVNKNEIREKYKIPHDKIILIAHGNISKTRGLKSLFEFSKKLDDKFVIIIHGKLLEKISEDIPPNILLNNQVYSESELLDFVAMSDIGLALYEGQSENDKLIAFSSHKMSIYARCGLPYIAFRNQSFDELNNIKEWGIQINDTSQIREAAIRITCNYEKYSNAAYEAYKLIYNIDGYRHALLNYLVSNHS